MKKFLFSLILCISAATTALAVDINITVNNDVEPQEVTVTGGGAGEYKLVNLQVMEFNKDKSTLDGASGSVRDKVLYFGSSLSDVNGNFGFAAFKQVTADGNNGTYTAWLAVEDGEMYSKDYTFYSVTDIRNFVSDAKKMTSKEALSQHIAERGYLLDLHTRFETLDSASRINLANILIGKPKTIFDSTGAFADAFAGAYAIENFNVAATVTEVQSALASYAAWIDLSKSGAYAVFNKASWVGASQRDEIYTALGNKKDFQSEQDILDFFADKSIITALTGAGNISVSDSIIAAVAGIIKIDYAALSSDAAAWRNKLASLKPADYTSLETLKSALEKKAVPPTTPPGESGRGGGGIGSGGTAIKADKDILIPNADISAELPIQSARPFNDIEDYVWAAEAINSLAERGILSGRGNGEFVPADNITREEFTKILVAAMGLETEATAVFEDLPLGHWAYKYVAGAVKAGLINGLGDGNFGIGQNIIRQDMAALIYRIAQNNGIETDTSEPPFDDYYTVDAYAARAVAGAYSAGLVQGFGKSFNPHGTLTRAEAAVVVYRLLGGLGK
jgi:hypothetical protein